MHRYDLHGIVIASTRTLPATPRLDEAAPTLSVSFSEHPPAEPFAADHVVAALDVPGARYVARVGDGGLLVHYAGLAEVRFSKRGDVHVHSLDATRDSLVPLFCGSALALFLTLQGNLVLHASAVALDERAIAIVGASNAGKSTLAAQLARVGAVVVSDDVLRVDAPAGTAHWCVGVRELRLRQRSTSLGSDWLGCSRLSDADGRLVLTHVAEVVPPRRGPLHAVVFPEVRPQLSAPELRAISGAAALARMCLAPRVRGLLDRPALEKQLAAAARLARTVPSFEVRMPEGPPFEDAWAGQLLRDLLG